MTTELQKDSRYPIELSAHIDKTKTQPSLTTPEGQALWALFVFIMTEDDGTVADPEAGPSGADTCDRLYTVLGRFGLNVP